MKKFLIGLILLLTSTSASAGTYFSYGLGVFGSAQYGRGETKAFNLGYEEKWFGPFIRQGELGLYADQGGNGRNSSGYGNYSVGVEANPGYFVARSMWGLGFITTPDSQLGGVVQFNQDLLLGVRDNKGNLIGLDYKHISSAGIESPNRGRDFLLLHVEIPW